MACYNICYFFFFQAEDGIRDLYVTGVQTCALPIWSCQAPSRLNLCADRHRTVPRRERAELGEVCAAATGWVDVSALRSYELGVVGAGSRRLFGPGGAAARWPDLRTPFPGIA